MKEKPAVPLVLDPGAAAKFRARDPATHEAVPDAALDALESGLTFAQTKARELADIVDAVSSDTTVTAGAGAMRIRTAALKIGEQAAAKLDAARAGLEREIAAIASGTHTPEPPRDAVAAQLEGEARGAFARMTDEARKAAWSAALKGNDEITLGALLRAPAYLSGQTDAQLELRRHAWRAKRWPDEVDREQRLKRAQEAAERAGASLIKFVERVASGPGAEASEAARHAAEMLKQAEAAAE